MTKADIVADIADETGLERVEALKAVEAFMASVKTSLSQGQNVYLRGFGSFIVKERAEKTGGSLHDQSKWFPCGRGSLLLGSCCMRRDGGRLGQPLKGTP